MERIESQIHPNRRRPPDAKEIEQELIRRMAAELEVAQADIAPEDSLAEHGLTSIAAVSLAVDIEGWLGVKVPATLLWDVPSITALATQLAAMASRSAVPWDSHPPLAQIEADARLDPSLVLPTPCPQERHPAKGVLLTGATGFFGGYLVSELIKRTDARLYCLVRARSEQEGLDRIREALKAKALWQDSFHQRIIAFPGDLSRPLFGLDEARFRHLAGSVDEIYHCGAQLNHTLPYEELRPANVFGTSEILRLAARERPRFVHFISTLAVFGAPAYFGKVAHEENRLPIENRPLVGYLLSKWVADRLLSEAQAKGLPAAIYRVGLLGGAQDSGASDADDILGRFLRSCVDLAVAPDVASRMDVAPVDYVARATVALSLRQEARGAIFHITHPRPLDWPTMREYLGRFGYPVGLVSYEEWKHTTVRHVETTPTSPLYPLIRLLSQNPSEEELSTLEMFLLGKFPEFQAKNTMRLLAEEGIECPDLDRTMFHRYLGWLVEKGFLPAPR